MNKAKLAYSSLSADIFNRAEFCLAVMQNCISLHNYGATQDVVDKYKYSDVAGLRYSCPDQQYFARYEDRDREGNVHINTPPIYTAGPVIATMITQYGIGRAIEENPIGQKMLRKCTDATITDMLEGDTVENRINNFNKCLYKLSTRLARPEYVHVKKVILPAGIGRSGVDDIWLNRYLPILSAFADDLFSRGMEVILVINRTYLNYLDRRYTGADEKMRERFEAFKNMPMISRDEVNLDMTLTYGENDEEGGADVPDNVSRYILP